MTVIVSDRAEYQLGFIYRNVFEHWGASSLIKFEERVQEVIQGLEANPYQFAADELKDGTRMRRVIVNKRTVLTYEIDALSQTVTILNAFAARTDWK
jgi:plasmid stabilization system protein ParE